MASSEMEAMKNMVMNFRVSELTMLLSFAGRSRSGRKTDLQLRALDLIKLKSSPINNKIRELYRSIQQQNVAMAGAAEQQQPPQPQPGYISMSATRSQSVAAAAAAAQASSKNPASYPTAEGLPGWLQVDPKNGIPYSGPYSSKPFIPPGATQTAFPVHPDVRLKKLPFFDSIAELLRPSSLVPQGSARYHEASFVFHLTPQQATDIASSRDARPGSKIDFINQIQMRFCLLETSCEQEDNFPSNLSVKINGKMVTLPNPIPTNKPGVEPKRPPRPVNVTSLCRLSPTVANQINVSWSSDLGGRGYVATVCIVRRLTSTDLLNRLKGKGLRPAEYTRGLIRDKLEDADTEIATTSLKVSLACPLGKMRMHLPCRATSCSHLQCFDASLFLQMNERKPTWLCPVCDKTVLYDQLAIDGYFSDILNSPVLPTDSMEVQLNVDGTWTILQAKKEQSGQKSTTAATTAVAAPATIMDSDVQTVDENDFELVCEAPPAKKKAPVTVDLTLSSSDSEEDENVLQEGLLRQRSSGSQSSRPSTADSVGTSATGASSSSCPLSLTTPCAAASSSSTSSRPPTDSLPSGMNGSQYNYMSGDYSSPVYYPSSSTSSTNGQHPYRHLYYSSYQGNELMSLLGHNGALMDNRSVIGGSSITAPDASSLTQSIPAASQTSNSSAGRVSRPTPSMPDIISLD